MLNFTADSSVSFPTTLRNRPKNALTIEAEAAVAQMAQHRGQTFTLPTANVADVDKTMNALRRAAVTHDVPLRLTHLESQGKIVAMVNVGQRVRRQRKAK